MGKMPGLKLMVMSAAVLGGLTVCLAQGGAPPPLTSTVSQETFFSLLLKGGYVMIPLVVCSIISLTVSIERIISLRQNNVVPTDFFKDMKRIAGENKEPKTRMDKVSDYCEKWKASPFARVIRAGIGKWRFDSKKEMVEKTIEDFASREVERMHRTLRTLKIIAAVSPLLGLLGTVFGMISAFQTVALSSDSFGKAEKLANGIYEAMVTTATGLTIAIPTLVVFYILSNKVDAFADDIEVSADRFMDETMELKG